MLERIIRRIKLKTDKVFKHNAQIDLGDIIDEDIPKYRYVAKYRTRNHYNKGLSDRDCEIISYDSDFDSLYNDCQDLFGMQPSFGPNTEGFFIVKETIE